MTRGPLAGRIVVTTRGETDDHPLAHGLACLGATVRTWPTASYVEPRDPAPLGSALAAVETYDWIVFTSARAVAAVGSPDTLGPRLRVGVVGAATGRTASAAGWAVTAVGPGPGANGLAQAADAVARLEGARVLFPAASGASDIVETEFAELGAEVHRVEAYHTVVEPPDPDMVRDDLRSGVDSVTFASPSAVAGVAAALGPEFADLMNGTAVVCIGPTTAAALADHGVEVARIAGEATFHGVVAAVVETVGRPSADEGTHPGAADATARNAGVGIAPTAADEQDDGHEEGQE